MQSETPPERPVTNDGIMSTIAYRHIDAGSYRDWSIGRNPKGPYRLHIACDLLSSTVQIYPDGKRNLLSHLGAAEVESMQVHDTVLRVTTRPTVFKKGSLTVTSQMDLRASTEYRDIKYRVPSRLVKSHRRLPTGDRLVTWQPLDFALDDRYVTENVFQFEDLLWMFINQLWDVAAFERGINGIETSRLLTQRRRRVRTIKRMLRLRNRQPAEIDERRNLASIAIVKGFRARTAFNRVRFDPQEAGFRAAWASFRALAGISSRQGTRPPKTPAAIELLAEYKRWHAARSLLGKRPRSE
jgi:hypothetical protein